MSHIPTGRPVGRPRKDGSDPIPRKLATVSAPAKPLISADQYNAIVASLEFLHGIVGTLGDKELPAFNECSDADLGVIFARAHDARRTYREHSDRAAILAVDAPVRNYVSALLTVATDKVAKAHTEYLALSDSLRAMMPAFPMIVSIPVGPAMLEPLRLLDPAVDSEEAMRKRLHNLGYRLSKSGNAYALNVPYVPAAVATEAENAVAESA